jgi:hypothetical protein
VRIILGSLLAATLCCTAASASDSNEVIARVQQLVSDFNTGDATALARNMADAPQIIYEFPPFTWSGVNALRDWDQALKVDAARRSIVKTVMLLRTTSHIDVRGSHAYVVVTALCDFTHENKRHTLETGSLTMVLTKSTPADQALAEKSNQDWRVSSFAWTKD